MPVLAFLALALIGSELGWLVSIQAGPVTLPAFSPAAGILVAALLIRDRRDWRALVPGVCAVMGASSALIHRQPIAASVALAAISGIEAWAIAALIRRQAGEFFGLDRIAHVWTFVVASTLVPAAAGVFVAIVLGLHGPISVADWRSWWLSETFGIVGIAPIVIAAATEWTAFAKAIQSKKVIEIVIVAAGALVVTEGVFGEWVNEYVRVPAYVLPFLLWAAFRFGPGGSALVMLGVCFVGLWNTAHGLGPFALAGAQPTDWVLRSQGSMIVVAVTFLLLSVAVEERRRIAQENAVLVLELQHALMEIKTLQGFIPICAWCHKVRNDAGFWQQIESYLDAHTDATFSHSICPACESEAHEEVLEHQHLYQRPQ